MVRTSAEKKQKSRDMTQSTSSENTDANNTLSVKAKVTATVMFCIMLLVGVSGVAIWQMTKVGEEIGSVVNFDLPVTEALTKTTVHQLEQAISFERSVRFGEEMVTLPMARPKFENATKKFTKLAKKVEMEIKEVTGLVSDAQINAPDPVTRQFFKGMLAKLRTISRSHSDYDRFAARIHKLLASGQVSGAQGQLPQIETLEDQLDKSLEALLFDVEKFTVKALAKAKQHEDAAIYQMTIISVIATMLGLGATYWLVNTVIARPLTDVTQAVERLTAGDLSATITKHRNDEIGQVASALQMFKDTALERKQLEAEAGTMRVAQEEAIDAIADALGTLAEGDLTVRIKKDLAGDYAKIKSDFNQAAERLEATVNHVLSGVDGMRTGTDEIAQASDDMSRRTETQAATLEQTAAAVAQITGAVQKSAQAAQEAQKISAEAQGQAEKGSDVVRSAIEAMGGIEKSSKEISDITNVIDEIAYQTNLLALNAGVEAARAGDAGRGFAVVASEVRALAQRSAAAAKQIKDLITNSAAQVTNGVGLVQNTGTALESIEQGVQKVNQAIGQISSSAKEQAVGLEEVNSAVTQLDQVTQQNAAMVEQSTAATRALADQGSELAGLVGQFRTMGASGEGDLRAQLEKAAPHVFQEPPAVPLQAAEPSPSKAEIPPPPPRLATGTDDGWEEF